MNRLLVRALLLTSILLPSLRAQEARFFRIAGPVPTTITAMTAGVNVSLSALWPKWQNTASRRSALGLAGRDTRRLLLLIAAILFVQAILEMLYVRQVLLHGGSGVPLAPY